MAQEAWDEEEAIGSFSAPPPIVEPAPPPWRVAGTGSSYNPMHPSSHSPFWPPPTSSSGLHSQSVTPSGDFTQMQYFDSPAPPAPSLPSSPDSSPHDSPHSSICYDRYFFSTDLALFLEVHLILSRHMIILSQGTLSFYLFSHEISISLMLSQPSLNFRAVHGYAFFSSLPFWCLMHHTCYASILCTAYLISAPTAQGLGFALCIQYR